MYRRNGHNRVRRPHQTNLVIARFMRATHFFGTKRVTRKRYSRAG
jgi:hypothetical protein